MITESLAGSRLAVTGATGFLGTALVERVLRCVPDCGLVLLVRPGRQATADERARRTIFGNDCFTRLRQEWGEDFDSRVADRVKVVAGDVTADGLGLDADARRLVSDCDVFVHSAATVSFDAPLDAAVQTNLMGPVRVVELLNDLDSGTRLVAVSTAYVNGSRRGRAPEAPLSETPFSPQVDWRSEVDAAGRIRNDFEAESRRPERLERFAAAARDELGAAGPPLLAAKTEKLREEWVANRLVEAGRARAKALGWPDAYAFTKALAERAMLEVRGNLAVSIVRPSIIESALAEPRPGWIRGFRMAEPVIISYGRGLLKEFPGIKEGIIDVVPVDMVVSTIIAAAAVAARTPPSPVPTPPSIYQAATGSRNPLRYDELVDLVRDYFRQHPIYDNDGQPIVTPQWSFSGRGRVQRQLERAIKILSVAEKTVSALPIRGERAEMTGRLEERRTQAERALDYVRLYGAYAECEATYDDTRLRELWESLDDDDRRTFGFDASVIDWRHYVQEIHLPCVVRQARVRTTGGPSKGPSRSDRARKAICSPDRHIAAFDLENTLIASNVVESYSWLATANMADERRPAFVARMLARAPSLWSLDRADRADFLRHFYRLYEDAPSEQVRHDAWELFSRLLLAKSFPAGIRRVREHRKAGTRTLLITGALEFAIEPLRPLFDDVVCAQMSQRSGRLTGELTSIPPTGEARAMVMTDYAEAHGLDLAQSVAYADSASDLPMLEAVGYPVAVNAEPRLAAIARKRGWHIEQWGPVPGAPKPFLPLAPRLARSR